MINILNINAESLNNIDWLNEETLSETIRLFYNSLLETLELQGDIFREHIALGSSVNVTFTATCQSMKFLDIKIEGLLSMYKGTGKGIPRVEVDILVFSQSERVGKLIDQGNSRFVFKYEFLSDQQGWIQEGWKGDEYGEWEQYAKLRLSEYDVFTKSFA